ncbi:HAMP domain-containing protein [Desulfococcaceae bacterium OttesenSCG-928-F15]|nr:HAMP domain-containing protein [Desulfococcaceae bacterium OttesenSCG-928-F15]
MATLICEECGKIYHLDPEKLKSKVPGDEAKTRCRECGHLIRISKALLDISETQAAPVEKEAEDEAAASGGRSQEAADSTETQIADDGFAQELHAHAAASREGLSQVRGMGLRTKMIILFLIVPLSFLAILGVVSQRQMNALLNTFSKESVAITKAMAEDSVAEISRGVAKRVPMYLETHPDLEALDFNYDPEFRNIAIQRIGKTGYTVLIEKPHAGESEYHFRIWVHPDANFVLSGAPLEEMIRRMVGSKFKPLFAEIMAGKEVRSNYLWQELNKDLREKFAILVPVEGTDFLIFASIYIDEFLAPVVQLEKDAQSLIRSARTGTIAILIAALLLMGMIILFYGYTISNNIKTLTDAANKISFGELDTKILISSTDEIGALATAISRMQDSLRLSISRLRRRQ